MSVFLDVGHISACSWSSLSLYSLKSSLQSKQNTIYLIWRFRCGCFGKAGWTLDSCKLDDCSNPHRQDGNLRCTNLRWIWPKCLLCLADIQGRIFGTNNSFKSYVFSLMDQGKKLLTLLYTFFSQHRLSSENWLKSHRFCTFGSGFEHHFGTSPIQSNSWMAHDPDRPCVGFEKQHLFT